MRRLTVRPASEGEIRQFVRWRYEPPYDVYNIVADEDPDEVAAQVVYFLDPAVGCHVVVDEAGALLAFCTFGPDGQVPGGDYSREALDIGMGVRPELTGRGLGERFVSAVLQFALEEYRPVTVRVTIAAANRRARRVWEKQGFREVSSFVASAWIERPFAILVRSAGGE